MTADSTGRPVAIRCGRLLDIETGETSAGRVLHVAVDGRVTAIASKDASTSLEPEMGPVTGPLPVA